jgi:hypothetical protein
MDARTVILIRDGERGTSRTALTASESDSPKEIAAGFQQKARTQSLAAVSKPARNWYHLARASGLKHHRIKACFPA